MQVYNIIIDEKQRKLIEKALSAAGPESLEFLNMIKDLPKTEKAHPGIVHGLCY